MSYSTMNGLNAARTGGLGGTRRMPLQGSALPLQHPVDPGANYTLPNPAVAVSPAAAGAGPSFADTRQTGRTSMVGSGGARAGLAGSFAPVVDGMNMGVAKRPTGPAPNAVDAVGGMQAPQFDPNDPNNAALVGYMNGA